MANQEKGKTITNNYRNKHLESWSAGKMVDGKSKCTKNKLSKPPLNSVVIIESSLDTSTDIRISGKTTIIFVILMQGFFPSKTGWTIGKAQSYKNSKIKGVLQLAFSIEANPFALLLDLRVT